MSEFDLTGNAILSSTDKNPKTLSITRKDTNSQTAGVTTFADIRMSISGVNNDLGVLAFLTNDGISNDERMRIDPDGNVGISIGARNPNAKLEVGGKVRIGDDLENTAGKQLIQGGSVIDWLRINPFDSFPRTALYGDVAVNTDGAGSAGVVIGAWESGIGKGRLKVHQDSYLAVSGGNVGIGTTSPENAEGWSKVIDVLGAGTTKLSVRTANIDARVLTHEVGWWGAPAGMIIGTKTSHPLSFGTNAASRMTIDSSGRVGVGTSIPKTSLNIPEQGLQIGTSSLAYNNFHMVSDTNGGLRGFRLYKGDYGAGTHLLTVLADGNVGIGATNPGAKLNVNGNILTSLLNFYGVGGNSYQPHNHYGIYQESGDWVHPYPDLVLNYHTGIKYVGYYGYGGHRFYTGYAPDATPTTEAFSIGNGDHNTRVNYDLYVSGNVGIGTTTPFEKLHIAGNLRIDGNLSFPNNRILNFKMGVYRWDAQEPNWQYIIGHEYYYGWWRWFSNIFSINSNGDLYCAGSKTGYVVDHFINGVGETLEQGDVVVISKYDVTHYSGDQNNIPIPEVDLTDTAYDSHVCGIVAKVVTENDLPYVEAEPSEKAKVRKGKKVAEEKIEEMYVHPLEQFAAKHKEDLDRKKVQDKQIGTMVTLGAFAHCKVDADIAPIEAGDLLTTSPTKGHAQKVIEPEKAIGAIIGKALGSIKKGKGKIPVMVMLQ